MKAVIQRGLEALWEDKDLKDRDNSNHLQDGRFQAGGPCTGPLLNLSEYNRGRTREGQSRRKPEAGE